MSISIEKLKKQIDRLKRQIHEDTKTFLEIFQRLRSAEHKLSVHEDALPCCARKGLWDSVNEFKQNP